MISYSHGTFRWLRRLQFMWPLVALLAIVVAGFALPGFVNDLRRGWPARELSAIAAPIFSLISVLSSFGLALLVYWRGHRDPMALGFAYYLLGFGLILGGPARELSISLTDAPDTGYAVASLFFSTPTIAFLVTFPTGLAQPRWARWLVPFSLVMVAVYLGIVGVTVLFRFPLELNIIYVMDTLVSSPVLIALLAQITRYRRIASPAEHRQMKWGIFGLALFFAAMLILNFPFVFELTLSGDAPEPVWLTTYKEADWTTSLNNLAINIIPVFFTIAILRGQLWDIDIIIRRTLVYSTLTAILATIYFGVVVISQGTFLALTGQESTLAVVISTLVIAALFRPARTRVQQFIDRRFFRQKYDAAQTLADFAEAVRDEIDVEDVEAALLRAVGETMQPESVSLWLREGGQS